jgi:DNA-binding IclR family transcriptional regulator
MDVSKIARRSEIPKRTTFRILETLQSEMLVSKKHLTAEYVLGEKFVCVARLSLENNY